MKRKAILIFAALLMVVSGVAAVSAYEAHVINVTAHVENALDVTTTAVDFGTVFPQEDLIRDREITLSDSANLTLDAGDLVSVSYAIWAEWKIDPGTPDHLPTVTGVGDGDYYAWLGHWLWVGIDPPNPTGASLDALWKHVGAPPAVQPDPTVKTTMAKPITGCTGTLTDDTPQTLRIMLLAPVFHTYYNDYTDVKPTWWPLELWAANKIDAQYADGWDGGVDLKIQVTGITR